ncbi:hypothetical protein H4Q32_025440 [Labeo rohita]|uniref:Uncharacterized protein n=1 Tax=Labeo rohita TaxID=84645 RepID=A0ABQ8L5F4_LABRO|nr:hypothetical protein H4Q32_025440 [Labeo rohita]
MCRPGAVGSVSSQLGLGPIYRQRSGLGSKFKAFLGSARSFQVLSAPPESTNIVDNPFNSVFSFDGMKESISQLREKIEDFCKEEFQKISDKVILTNIVPRTRNDFLQCNKDTWSLWQAIQTITDYKPLPQACDDNTSLPDALNEFYAGFEMQNDTPAQKLPTPPNHQALCLSPADVGKTLSRVNPRKAAGPDNIPGHALRDCAAQLTDVLTDIFNTSLSQAVVPTCLKSTSIIPVPKKSPLSCLNDYRPIALTPIMIKCFERLVINIKTSLPNTLDPL